LGELKASGKLVFGQIPLLEIDNKNLVQSVSIARYLSQKYGQYPHDINDVYQVEITKDYIEDLWQSFSSYFGIQDAEKKKLHHDKFLTETLAAKLPALNTLLKQNTTGSGYFVGHYLTLADFIVVDFAGKFLLHKDKTEEAKPLLAANPELNYYLNNIVAKEFKGYFENRKQSFV